MVYDKRPRRESQASSSYEQQTRSSSRNIDRASEPSPIIEKLRQKWIDKRQAREEQSWFDSLPEFDPDRRGASSTFDATEKPSSSKSKNNDKDPNPKKREKRFELNEVEKPDDDLSSGSVQVQERKEKKGLRGWFSKFGAGKNLGKQLKPNDKAPQPPAQTNKNNSDQLAEGNHDTSSLESSSDHSQTKLATEKNNAGSSKRNKNSGDSSIRGATQRIELPNRPIFVAPNLDAVKQANPETVLGKTSGGGIIYISKNPSAESEAVTQGTGIVELSTSQSSDIYQQQRDTAIQASGSVFDRGREAQLDISEGSSDNIAQIDSQIASSVTQTQSAIAAQKAAIAKVMQTWRTSIANQSDQTILTIDRQYNQTLNSIDARTASAQQKLSANKKRLGREIDRNYDTFTRRIDSAIATTRSVMKREYERTITATLRTQHGYIKKYRKESPTNGVRSPMPKALSASPGGLRRSERTSEPGGSRRSEGTSAFSRTRSSRPRLHNSSPLGNLLGKIGRDTYIENWRNAKIEATKKVAEGFRVSTTEAFNNNEATLDQYHSTTISGGRQFARHNKESIAASYQQTQQALFQQAAAAKARATQTHLQQIAGVRNQQADKLQQINTVEVQLQATLKHKGGEAIAEIQELGGVLRLSLRGAILTGQANLARAVSGFESGLSESDDPKAIAGAIVAARAATAALDEAFENAQYDIDTATKSALAQIKTTTGDILKGLSGVPEAASMQQASELAAYSEQLKQHSAIASSSFESMLAGFSQTQSTIVDKSIGQWNPIPDQMVESLIRVEVNLGKQLALSETQVIAQRQSIMTKLGAEIRNKSNTEASKVQPAWKKVVKLVVNIGISVATTVAVAALASSGVGLVAAIGLAALIGAAGGVAKLAANDLIDGKTSSASNYLKAGGIGAATGILEGLGAKAVVGVGGKLGAQMLTKIEHMVASTGIEAVTNTLVELTESMGQGQDFTLKLLGVSILSSLLSTAGGKYIDVKFSDIARGAARGVGNGAGDAVLGGVTDEVVRESFGKAAGQFATETAFDTAVDTGASAARGEELTWESFGENLAGGVLGRGAAGRADKLYGNKLRGLGNSQPHTSRRDGGVGDNNVIRANNANNTNDRNTDTTRNNPDSDTPGGNRDSSHGNASRMPIPTNQKRNREFERVASVGLSRRVTVYTDPDLFGNTVRAEYKLNSRGVVQDVHLRVGPDATANDIKLHQHTVKVMRMYGGTLGKVRLVEAYIAKWIGIHGQPQTGTRAWEAQHEIPKLNSIISDRLQTLQTANPQQAQRLESEIEYLIEQLDSHRRTFEAMDESDGVGYIAGLSKEKKLESIAQLKQQFGERDFSKLDIIDKLGWNNDSPKTVYNKLRDLQQDTEETLFYNKETDRYSYDPNNPQITYKEYQEKFKQIKPSLTGKSLIQKEIGAIIEQQTGEKLSRGQLDRLIKEWIEDEGINIHKVGKKYVFDSDSPEIDASAIKNKAKQQKLLEANKKRASSAEYQSIRSEFFDDLGSGKFNQEAFDQIYDEWYEILQNWQSIDSSIDFRQIIRDTAGKNKIKAIKDFRSRVRLAVADVVLKLPPDQRIKKLNQFFKPLGKTEARTKGEIFTRFREEYLTRLSQSNLSHPDATIKPFGNDNLSTNVDSGLDGNANQKAIEAGLSKPAVNKHYIDLGASISDPKSRYRLVQTKRQVDGFIKIADEVPGSPGVGNYLVEDKAGRSFNLKQAEGYSAHIMKGKDKGKISTRESGAGKSQKLAGQYDGVVYFFEDRKYANSAIEKLSKLEAYKEGYMHVAFFDKGVIKWAKRIIL